MLGIDLNLGKIHDCKDFSFWCKNFADIFRNQNDLRQQKQKKILKGRNQLHELVLNGVPFWKCVVKRSCLWQYSIACFYEENLYKKIPVLYLSLEVVSTWLGQLCTAKKPHLTGWGKDWIVTGWILWGRIEARKVICECVHACC